MNPGINLITPLVYDPSDGPYKTTKNMIDAIKQNLKVLFLTNPGERIMNGDYGIGVKRFLFENISTSLIEKIKEKIYLQCSRYMSYIIIKKLNVDFNEFSKILTVSMGFSVNGVTPYSLFELALKE